MSMDYKGMEVYSHQKNRVFDEFLARARSRFPGTRMVSRQEGVKTLLRGFKNGLGLQLSPDLDLVPLDAIFVPFFGVQAATVTALSRLARLADAVVKEDEDVGQALRTGIDPRHAACGRGAETIRSSSSTERSSSAAVTGG